MLCAKDNPFSVDRVLQIRYRFQHGTWEELLERLDALRGRGAIVGPHGSGKTTLLEDLRPHLESQGRAVFALRLNREPRFTTRWMQGPQRVDVQAPNSVVQSWPWRQFLREMNQLVGPRDVVCLDGAEQLGRWQWRQFRDQAAHCGGLLITTHRAGRMPTLWRCTTSPQLLSELIAQLVPAGCDDLVDQSPTLFRRHRGNLRDALRALYDHVGDTWPGHSSAAASPNWMVSPVALSASSRLNLELESDVPGLRMASDPATQPQD